jgi:hypothetical protein
VTAKLSSLTPRLKPLGSRIAVPRDRKRQPSSSRQRSFNDLRQAHVKTSKELPMITWIRSAAIGDFRPTRDHARVSNVPLV